MTLLDFFYNFKSTPINLIPVNKDKTPLFPWAKYQTEKIDDNMVKSILSSMNDNNIALITGNICGYECIDFDNKIDDLRDIVQSFVTEMVLLGLNNKIYAETTMSGGFHFIFKSKNVGKNTKIASRKEYNQVKTFIETRGEGGYVVISPSKNYVDCKTAITDIVDFNKFSDNLFDLEYLTDDERETIFSFLKSFDEQIEYKDINIEVDNKIVNQFALNTNISKFNSSDDGLRIACEVLEQNGWTPSRINKYGLQEYTRPNKKSGVSGGWIKDNGVYLFRVFTSSTILQQKAYTPFSLISALQFNNNYNDTRAFLKSKGFAITREDNKDIKRKIFMDTVANTMKELNIFSLIDEKNKKPTLFVVNNKIARHINIYEVRYLLVNHNEDIKIKVNSLTDNIIFTSNIATNNDFYSDDNSTRLFFRNKDTNETKVIEITKNNVSLKDLDKYVWDKNVIDVDNEFFDNLFLGSYDEINEKIKDYFYYDAKYNDKGFCDGLKEKNNIKYKVPSFLRYVSSKIVDEKSKTYMINENNLNKLLCSIGYLLTPNSDVGKISNKIVIYSDDTDNIYRNERDGGRGKSLLCKMIGFFQKTCFVAGKFHNSSDKFAFQNVDYDTKIMCIDDVTTKFSIQDLYNLDNIKIEKKGQEAFSIPNLKVMVTTNHRANDFEKSTLRRIIDVKFSRFFNIDYEPINHFSDDKDSNFVFFSINSQAQRSFGSLTSFDFAVSVNTFVYSIMKYLNEGVKNETISNDFIEDSLLIKNGLTDCKGLIYELQTDLFLSQKTFSLEDVYNIIRSFKSSDDERSLRSVWNTNKLSSFLNDCFRALKYDFEKKRINIKDNYTGIVRKETRYLTRVTNETIIIKDTENILVNDFDKTESEEPLNVFFD